MELNELKELFLSRFDSIDSRLEKIDDKAQRIEIECAKQEVTLSNQHNSLEEHIKRTELLEIAVEIIAKKAHWVEGAFKLIGLLSLIGGLIITYIRIF